LRALQILRTIERGSTQLLRALDGWVLAHKPVSVAVRCDSASRGIAVSDWRVATAARVPQCEDLNTVWRLCDEAIVQVVPYPCEVHAAHTPQTYISGATADIGLNGQQ